MIKKGLCRSLLLFFSCILLLQCQEKPINEEGYIKSVEDWQEERNEEMRDTANSWLNLVALHWLEEGESTFGSDSSNTIIFPAAAPAFSGKFIFEADELKIIVNEGAGVYCNGEVVEEMLVLHDMEDKPTYFQMGSIRFFAIKRPEGMAIRVKDSKNPDLVNFKDIPNFEIDSKWKLEARLDWFEVPKPIQIPTVLNSERTQKCPAILVFEIDGEEFELYPYASFYGDPVWTIIFSDMTNGEDSYGGGRFLSLDQPEEGAESIVLDFNKAYNPPCSFSPFATCPLPPPENRLAVAIPAGERNYGKH